MLNWIYDIPLWLLAVLFCAVFLGLTWVGLLVTRPSLRRWIGHDEGWNHVMGHVLASHGVLYGILLALLALGALENRTRLLDTVGREAATLKALYHDTSVYPEPFRSELTAQLRDYCTYVIEVSDPVAASAAQQDARVRAVPGVRGLDRSQLRVERLREGVYRLSGEFKPIDNPLAKPDQPGEVLAANAMLLAMMGNRYVTLTVSAARIENATGEVQADGRKVVWKLPLMALVKATAGMPYEIRADIVYAESWTNKAKRWLGLD